MKNLIFCTVVLLAMSTDLFAQTGNVGIGVATPATKLDVNGSFRTQPLSPNTNGGSGEIPVTTSAFFVANANYASPLMLPANPAAGQRLVIYSQAQFTTVISTVNTSLTTPVNLLSGEMYEFVGNGASWSLTPSADPAKRYDYDWMKVGNTFPGSPGDTVQNIYHIGGNIGIGISDPKQQLHIQGDGLTTGITDSYISGIAITGSGQSSDRSGPGMYLENTNSPAGNRLLKINYTLNATEPIMNFQAVSDNAGASGSTLMAVTRSGKLGINGVTDPANNLSVNGNASIGAGYIGTAAPANGAIIEGNVGIGTTTMSAKLTVSGDGSGSVPILSLTNTNVTGNPTLSIYPGYTSNGSSLVSGNQYGVVFDQNPGTTGPGALSLYDFHGQIRSGSSATLSDGRLKTNIKDLTGHGLADIMKLQPRTYTLKEYGTQDVGLIAQELKEVFPEIVFGDEQKGLLSVDYSKISLLLINAVKEQQRLIEQQQKQMENLQSANTALNEKINMVEQLAAEVNALKTNMQKLAAIQNQSAIAVK